MSTGGMNGETRACGVRSRSLLVWCGASVAVDGSNGCERDVVLGCGVFVKFGKCCEVVDRI